MISVVIYCGVSIVTFIISYILSTRRYRYLTNQKARIIALFSGERIFTLLLEVYDIDGNKRIIKSEAYPLESSNGLSKGDSIDICIASTGVLHTGTEVLLSGNFNTAYNLSLGKISKTLYQIGIIFLITAMVVYLINTL